MKKRLLSLFLVFVTLLGILPTAALAANTEEEALGEVDIYNGGYELSYLTINGRIRTQDYTYFNYVDAKGQKKEVPAYCVNPNIKGVPQTVGVGESIKYLANERSSDPKVVGIISNGYPHRSLGELKLDNKYQAYYATKMALWCYLLPNWNIANLKVAPGLTGSELDIGNRILAAAKDIYKRGTTYNYMLEPRMTATPDKSVAYSVTVDGKQYKQQVFTIWSETWVYDYDVAVSFADPGSVPQGTRIVDENNQDITAVTTKWTGDGYAPSRCVGSAMSSGTASCGPSSDTEKHFPRIPFNTLVSLKMSKRGCCGWLEAKRSPCWRNMISPNRTPRSSAKRQGSFRLSMNSQTGAAAGSAPMPSKKNCGTSTTITRICGIGCWNCRLYRGKYRKNLTASGAFPILTHCSVRRMPAMRQPERQHNRKRSERNEQPEV